MLAFARLPRPVDFDAPDGEGARLVFLLLMSPRQYQEQLQLLSAMARLMTREEVRAALLRAGDEAAVTASLEEAGRASLVAGGAAIKVSS
jgi:PTS system nitrogen regulatory IIA component